MEQCPALSLGHGREALHAVASAALVPGGERGEVACRRGGCGWEQELVEGKLGFGRATLCMWYVKKIMIGTCRALS